MTFLINYKLEAEAFVIVEVSYSVLSPSQMPYVITAVIFADANWSVGDGRVILSNCYWV